MRKAQLGTRRMKNAFANGEIIEVDRSVLGSKIYPIVVFRGERNESRTWCATFLKLPGYLGIGQTEVEAIAKLWAMSGKGPIYNVSKCRGLEPTAENIQKSLFRAQRNHAASSMVKGTGTRKHEVIVAVAKENSLSVNSLKLALSREDAWELLGGLNLTVSQLSFDHQGIASGHFRDMASIQAYFEDNPERARLVLARLKFPVHVRDSA